MTSEIEAVVVEHGGKSYVKLVKHGYGFPAPNTFAVNGERNLPTAPGDDNFIVYNGVPVTSIQRITPPQRIVTKYELRADLRGSKKPCVISVDQYRNLDNSDQALYAAAYEDLPEKAQDVPFVIQTEDGPPSKLPQGVVCTDRNYFARFRSFWHLGPVRATPRYVLCKVAERLQEIVDGNPYIDRGTLWNSAEKLAKEQYSTSITVSVKPMILNGIEITPKGMSHWFTIDSKERLQGYQTLVKAVEAESLDALNAAVDQYVGKLTALLSKWTTPGKCPCCQRRYAKKPDARPKARLR